MDPGRAFANEGGAALSKSRNGDNPRSVALVGPQGSGKSTLFDALMETAGAAVKRPADPRNRPATTSIRVGHCTFLNEAWSILDCPGSIEFAHEVHAALAMVDIAIVVCEPPIRAPAAIAPVLRALAAESVPHIVLINKIDTFEGSVGDVIAALQGYASSPLVLRQMPITEGRGASAAILSTSRASALSLSQRRRPQELIPHKP